MSIITLGVYALLACVLGAVASAVTLIVTNAQNAREWRERQVPIDWTPQYVGPERTELPPRAPVSDVPAGLEQYVDYDRASALHTAPIDYARAMKAAAAQAVEWKIQAEMDEMVREDADSMASQTPRSV